MSCHSQRKQKPQVKERGRARGRGRVRERATGKQETYGLCLHSLRHIHARTHAHPHTHSQAPSAAAVVRFPAAATVIFLEFLCGSLQLLSTCPSLPSSSPFFQPLSLPLPLPLPPSLSFCCLARSLYCPLINVNYPF